MRLCKGGRWLKRVHAREGACVKESIGASARMRLCEGGRWLKRVHAREGACVKESIGRARPRRVRAGLGGPTN